MRSLLAHVALGVLLGVFLLGIGAMVCGLGYLVLDQWRLMHPTDPLPSGSVQWPGGIYVTALRTERDPLDGHPVVSFLLESTGPLRQTGVYPFCKFRDDHGTIDAWGNDSDLDLEVGEIRRVRVEAVDITGPIATFDCRVTTTTTEPSQ